MIYKTDIKTKIQKHMKNKYKTYVYIFIKRYIKTI